MDLKYKYMDLKYKYGPQIQIYGPQIQIYGPQIQIQIYGPQIQIYRPQIQIYGPQIQINFKYRESDNPGEQQPAVVDSKTAPFSNLFSHRPSWIGVQIQLQKQIQIQIQEISQRTCSWIVGQLTENPFLPTSRPLLWMHVLPVDYFSYSSHTNANIKTNTNANTNTSANTNTNTNTNTDLQVQLSDASAPWPPVYLTVGETNQKPGPPGYN